MRSEKDLVCPVEKICKSYNSYTERNNFAVVKEEIPSKIIGYAVNYFCKALYSVEQSKRIKGQGKDCALIQLLNNTDALLHLSNKADL